MIQHWELRLVNLFPYDTKTFVNGKFCKDPKQATADDFLFMWFRNPGNTANLLRSKATQAFVEQFLGLNTLGTSMARIDFAPSALKPPLSQPRGSEVLVMVEGMLLVGFVTSNQLKNTLFTKLNIGNTYALAFSGLSCQNPGVITIANAVFGVKPPISAEALTKAFQVDQKVVDYLQAQFWYNNN
ncbi:germin-like protein subfamily 1 member 7 [Rhodamnia argentea]|uniref:Germin-like protein subfamily 1 member 7 n=1 Tax=Rhodamnia argentea TaxID=178133 RepID=A0ABM3HA40_9MYRT|nr:germin-like protein subfamily 1 member 7 [Rhodamnia argentea]